MLTQRKKIFLLVMLVAVVLLARFSPLSQVITFENIKRHREALFTLVQGSYSLSVVLYILIYIVVAALSIPGAGIMTLTGGFLFGTALAAVYVDVGATIGAALAFLFARYLLGNRFQEKYYLQLKRFNEEIDRNGVHYLVTVRFIPLFPFFVINFLAGLTKVPLRVFVWTTALGIIPATLAFAFAGKQIGSINSLSDILSKRMLAAFAALALLTLVPVFVKRVRSGKRSSGGMGPR